MQYAGSKNSDFIDVQKLIKALSIEEHCQNAEKYFSRLKNFDYLQSKPFASIDEAPELLTSFAELLQGLRLSPGMTILDFGAGSCWMSRCLTQLGLKVISLDVSPAALKIGKELYERQPVFGDQPKPEFLTFDGKKIDLPDGSVDRIICLGSWHHVSNPHRILGELGRILKEGGVAGFAEPGPNHSKMAQSQYEMKNFQVVENDINIREIWETAGKAGFDDIKVAVYNSIPFHLSLNEFDRFLQGGKQNSHYLETVRSFIQDHRIFFLFKGKPKTLDSSQRSGLTAEIKLETSSKAAGEGEPIVCRVTVANTGKAIWLPTSSRFGPVHLGCHLLDESGLVLDLDYFRQKITPGEGRAVHPGEIIKFETRIPSPPSKKYILEFDMVSESVCWFVLNGSKIAKLKVDGENAAQIIYQKNLPRKRGLWSRIKSFLRKLGL